MPKDTLNEREFELINIIGAQLSANQRDLSRHLDLSLGATNMLIRRLVSKGYIRISQLNKRKVQYILTPKGFTEKMRKSIKYTVKTINSIGLIKEQIKKIVLKLYEKGERDFNLLGDSDLVILVETVFREEPLKDCRISRVSEIPQIENKGVLLVCKEGIDETRLSIKKYVIMIKELAQNNGFITHYKDE